MNDSIALFVDLETLARTEPPSRSEVSLNAVMAAAEQRGAVSIRRAFGDVNGGHKDNPALAQEIKNAIAGHLLQVEHIPLSPQQSALVATRLVVEALGVAYTVKSVNCFVFVGIDPTVAPLLGKLRELGHRVVVFADAETCDASSVRLISNECVPFSALSIAAAAPEKAAPTVQTPVAVIPAQPRSPAPTTVRREAAPAPSAPPAAALPPPQPDPKVEAVTAACRDFCAALDDVLRKGRKPVVSAIAFELARLYPALDFRKLGLRDADELAVEAEKRGYVRLSPFGNATFVKPGQLPIREDSASAPVASASRSPDLTAFRRIIEDRLKCALPPLAIRRRIYEQAAKLFADLQEGEENRPVTLMDLSNAVAARLSPKVDQPTVFKVLFTLLLANAFITEQTDPRPHTILIKEIVEPAARWDELLIRLCVGMLRRNGGEQALSIEVLCVLFEAPPEVMVRLAE